VSLHAKQTGNSKILFPIKRLLYLELTSPTTTTMISNDYNKRTHEDDVGDDTPFVVRAAMINCHDERAITV